MMKLVVEITPSYVEGVVGVMALSELLYKLSQGFWGSDFYVLQGPPQTRTVILSMAVMDQQTGTVLTGELVTTPDK